MAKETFADRLKYVMEKKGKKQVDLIRLAEEQGVKLGKSQVSQYVSGKNGSARGYSKISGGCAGCGSGLAWRKGACGCAGCSSGKERRTGARRAGTKKRQYSGRRKHAEIAGIQKINEAG